MIPSTQDVEKRLAQLKREVPTRGFERHPSLLKNLANLPAELQCPEVKALGTGETYQTIISFPPQIQRGRHYVPKQAMLFSPTEIIHILASIWPQEAPQVTKLKGRDILYLRVSLLLLYGFLEIVGQGQESPNHISVEFNTVAWDKLSSPIRQLLQTTKPVPATPDEKSTYAPGMQAACERLPLKFSNGIKIHGLLPGEELQDFVFQPGIKERLLFLFNRSILANTLLLLSSNFVAVIQEELRVAQGWILSFIPHSNIIGIQNQPLSQWNELTFQLRRAGQVADYKLRLNNEASEAWRSIWTGHGGQWHQYSPDLPDSKTV
jgi:hypothetical protein